MEKQEIAIKPNVFITEKTATLHGKTQTEVIIINDGEERHLGTLLSDDYYTESIVYNNDYVIFYAKGCMVNQIPLTVNEVYEIDTNKFIDLSGYYLSRIFESMFITKRIFDFSTVASVLTSQVLVADKNEIDDLITYLLNGNLGDDANSNYLIAAEYILNQFPQLKDMVSLNNCNSIHQALKWLHEQEKTYGDSFALHSMPTKLENLSYKKGKQLTKN